MKNKTVPIITSADFEEAFGEGFFDLPHEDRFDKVIRKMLGQDVEKVTREDARRHNEGQTVHNRTESGD